MRSFTACLLLPSLALVACGEVVNVGGPTALDAATDLPAASRDAARSQPDSADAGRRSVDAASADSARSAPDAPVDDDATTSGPCPPPDLEPEVGGKVACGQEGLSCEYGSDPALECDTVWTCQGGGWVKTQAPAGAAFCSTGANPSACFAGPNDTLVGAPCGGAFLECYYPTANVDPKISSPPGRCECRCAGSGDGTTCAPDQFGWQCDTLDPAEEELCPLVRPRLGTSCPDEGNICSYTGQGSACWGDTEQCTGGLWTGGASAGC